MNSSVTATAPRLPPANPTAAANAGTTNAAFNTLSRCPPIIPMWPKASQVSTPMTGTQTARTASAARTIAAAPRATIPPRTAMAMATMVNPFWPVTCMRTPTRRGDPARIPPMRSSPSTVTAAARHTYWGESQPIG